MKGKKYIRKLKSPKTIKIIGLMGTLLLTALIAHRSYKADEKLISLSIIPLIAGLVFEFKMVAKNWKTVMNTLIIAYLLSFLVFLPVKNEYIYILNNHIEYWPYVFCFFLIISALANFEKQFIPKLHEGITLLQSVTFIYWIADYGFINTEYVFMKIIIGIGLILCSFSLLHALSYIKLSWTNRFFLSFWSSIIMIIFSVDNIWYVYSFCKIDFNDSWEVLSINILQYFMLGISSIYIVHNIYMVIGFLPGKHTFFNEQYFNDTNRLKLQHTERYSASQVNILSSILILFFSLLIYGLNYHYHLLPRNLIIWMLFFIYPLFISFINEPPLKPKSLAK